MVSFSMYLDGVIVVTFSRRTVFPTVPSQLHKYQRSRRLREKVAPRTFHHAPKKNRTVVLKNKSTNAEAYMTANARSRTKRCASFHVNVDRQCPLFHLRAHQFWPIRDNDVLRKEFPAGTIHSQCNTNVSGSISSDAFGSNRVFGRLTLARTSLSEASKTFDTHHLPSQKPTKTANSPSLNPFLYCSFLFEESKLPWRSSVVLLWR